jgi:hypothetical protein
MLPRTAPRWIAPIVALVVVVASAACSPTPAASFDPTGACSGDGAAPGAYAELEAMIPTTYHDASPQKLDSGRNCTPENLGSLAAAGIDELRFAGGTWTFGEPAVVLAVFTAPGLTADLLADYYANSAGAANRTEIVGQSSPTIAERQGRRLDTKTGDRQQSVIVWPALAQDTVNVVITHDMPEARISEAIGAFGGD